MHYPLDLTITVDYIAHHKSLVALVCVGQPTQILEVFHHEFIADLAEKQLR